MSKKKSRQLSSDEEALWRQVTKDITPNPRIFKENEPQALHKTPKTAIKTLQRQKPPQAQKQYTKPIEAIDSKSRRRLIRGQASLEAVLDLHGLTQENAYRKLAQFLISSHAKGRRFVLVVTGKGASVDSATGERGVLRRMVPLWLKDARLAPLVIGFEQAHQSHGGSGALYIHLRRKRAA